MSPSSTKRSLYWLMGLLIVCVLPPASAQTTNGEWRSYGGDLASSKYSPLDQINADNFSNLEIAFRWKSVDAFLNKTVAGGEWTSSSTNIFAELQKENPDRWRGEREPRLASLKATPLMVDGILYMVTALYQAAAIDARTGETLWVYNPKSYEAGTPTMSIYWQHRGPAYWTDGLESRILWGTGDGYLYSVDAKTGHPNADFGENGRVDLTKTIPRAQRGGKDYLNALLYSCASPPLVIGDVIVTGASIADRRVVKESPPGWVRGWNVKTGELKWTFKTVPEGEELGADTWENDSWKYSGGANVWTQMSADPELGYVYLPTGTGTNDFYGGDRLGDNLFAESLICVDAETGARIWHFQMIHHGVWDYDNPAAPNLLDITVDGKVIKAVAQITKQGYVYAFNRETGEPIWPIEETPVDTNTDMPGERLSPTQPIPTKPAPFEYQGASEDDLIDFTPEIKEAALKELAQYKIGPLFTPPGKKGTIMRPGLGGGANWTGAAVDPETGMLYIPSRSGHSVVHFYTPGDDLGGNLKYTHGARGGRGAGPFQLPLFKPPYSRMTAIDMNTGDHAWMVPTGAGNHVRDHEKLKDLNLPPVGGDARTGPLLTKTLLIYGESPRDGSHALVALDKTNGYILGRVSIPGRPIGTPMTYQLDEKQYIAVTVSASPPELVTLALP
ncbi:MAG: pyrroloquinoline quinone-dependent dehydrogenase [Candidatus Hydrogenedentota bacterium]